MPLQFELLGFHACQTAHVLDFFNYLFDRLEEECDYTNIDRGTPLKRIIELGCGGGGLSTFLALYCCEHDVEYHLFDYGPNTYYPKPISRLGAIFHHCNIFEENVAKFITELIQREGISLVLCDNGDKVREFNTYAAVVKVGDIICAHDYSDSMEKFMREMHGNVWDSMEISHKDIRESCDKFSLATFHEGIANQQAWTCRRREA